MKVILKGELAQSTGVMTVVLCFAGSGMAQSTTNAPAFNSSSKVGNVIEGDDLMHTVTVPVSGPVQFFRLSAVYPSGD